MERQLAWLGMVRNFSLNGVFCGRKSLNSFVTVRRGQNIQKSPFLLPANEYGLSHCVFWTTGSRKQLFLGSEHKSICWKGKKWLNGEIFVSTDRYFILDRRGTHG